MRTLLAAAVSLTLAVLALPGCAEDGSAPEGEAATEQDFVGKGGVTLTAPGDKDLQISLMMLDGVKAKTKDKRFLKATVTRKGKSFGAFCNFGVTLEGASRVVGIGCNMGVTTVSNDDDESLSFGITMRRTPAGDTFVLADPSYSGDGTFLGKEAAILGHTDAAYGFELPLVAREGKDASKNVFLLARTLLDGAAPILAEKVRSEEVDAPVAVKSLSLSVDEKLDVSTSISLGKTGRLHASLDKVSLLAKPGDLSKGTLASAAITAKLKAELPQ